MEKTYEVTGMKMPRLCHKSELKKLSAVSGVKAVNVDLEKKQATITGRPFKFFLKRALKGTKFKPRKRN